MDALDNWIKADIKRLIGVVACAVLIYLTGTMKGVVRVIWPGDV